MSKRESTYLDMCPELAHIVDAAQGEERAAFENVAKHCIVREGAADPEGRLADGGKFEL
jgi:hypothetical protein